MNTSKHIALRSVIEETEDAYRTFSDYHQANADFAEFAGMALTQFKQAMQTPDLTNEDLQSVLRRGMTNHRASGASESGWSAFMASYVTRAMNDKAFEIA